MLKWLPSLGGFGVAISICLGVMFGAGGYTFYYAEGGSYLSNDPTACINCHVMRDQYDGWLKASHHAAATCNDCHVPHDGPAKWYVKAENGYHHSKAFTFENFHEPIQMRDESRAIVVANCIDCHQQITSEIASHPALAAEPLDCIRCHASVGHGPGK